MEEVENYDYQIEKLKLEIKELKISRFKKPEYLKIYILLIFSIGTILIGFFNGFFSTKSSELNNQEILLEIKKREIKYEKDSIVNEFKNFVYNYNIIKDSLEFYNNKMLDSLSGLSKKYNNMILEYNKINTQLKQSTNKEKALQLQISEIINENRKVNNVVVIREKKLDENAETESKTDENFKKFMENFDQEAFARMLEFPPNAKYSTIYYGEMDTRKFCKKYNINYNNFIEDNKNIGSYIKYGQTLYFREKVKL